MHSRGIPPTFISHFKFGLYTIFEFKRNSLLFYFANRSPIIFSGTNDEPEFLVLQGEVIMRTHQCKLIAILPNP